MKPDVRWPLLPGYRIEPFADGAPVSTNDVLALWERERVVGGDEALRRVHEVVMVATHDDDGLVGVSSAYLERDARLRLDVWKVRVFVAATRRLDNLAVLLMQRTTGHLIERYVSGDDTRASGILLDVENEGLQQRRTRGYWRATGYSFIGVNAAGDHQRVRWFPGAKAPAAP